MSDSWDDDGDDRFFDRIASMSAPDTGDQVASDERVQQLLSLVSEGDRRVIVLAILVGFKGPDLALRLGITHAHARARLHRALAHLRRRFNELEKKEDGNA